MRWKAYFYKKKAFFFPYGWESILLSIRMRWKAYFYLNPEVSNNNRETYGFNSKNTPPHIPELESFENRLLDMIHNVKFKNVKCGYQKNDVKNIKKSESLFVPVYHA